MTDRIQPLRTVVATLVGGAVGAIGTAYAAGSVAAGFDRVQGLAALGYAIVGAVIGAFVGAGLALWVAFRHEPRRCRALLLVVMVVAGIAVFSGLQAALGLLDPSLSLPPLYLAIGLVSGALIGRFVVRRRSLRET